MRILFSELQRRNAILPGEKPIQIARIDISHLNGNLFNRHFGIDQHIFHAFQPVSQKVLRIILAKISFEKTTDIFGRYIEFVGQYLQFQAFGLMNVLLNVLQHILRFVVVDVVVFRCDFRQTSGAEQNDGVHIILQQLFGQVLFVACFAKNYVHQLADSPKIIVRKIDPKAIFYLEKRLKFVVGVIRKIVLCKANEDELAAGFYCEYVRTIGRNKKQIALVIGRMPLTAPKNRRVEIASSIDDVNHFVERVLMFSQWKIVVFPQKHFDRAV